ncbi:MAG: chemotaxis response regulator protein-glutamate methylesterase [Verrucomicrobiota bacterium]
MAKIRILVVDDAVVIRRLITETLQLDQELEVVGVTANGKIALQKIPQVNPDLITLDVEMPEMDGLATLREIRKVYPKLPVIMFSTLTQKGGTATLEALSLGASDYVTKPANVGSVTEAIERLQQDLIPKIKLHCRRSSSALASRVNTPLSVQPLPPVRSKPPHTGPIEIVCLGTSTGGPNALAEVFAHLPPNLSVPIVIVQHMPPLFTALLAERISAHATIPCHEGAEGQLLECGHAYLAPGGKHMEVRRNGPRTTLHLHDGPPENSCRPAVDVLFRSVAAAYGGGVLGVVMTGMGQDGLRGCEHIHEQGGRVLAQDEKTSVVWGMPGFVARAGLAEAVLPIDQIAGEISRRVTGKQPKVSGAA